VFLGFVIGARPSTLRPLRRSGSETDVLWDERLVLLRRSNPAGDEIMDQTKTGLDQDIPLPPAAMRVLREHVAALPRGPMRDSVFLFPSTTGGMRSRSALDTPFRDVLKALGWSVRLTPRGMRRTFQDLARQADVHDVVTHEAAARSLAPGGVTDIDCITRDVAAPSAADSRRFRLRRRGHRRRPGSRPQPGLHVTGATRNSRLARNLVEAPLLLSP